MVEAEVDPGVILRLNVSASSEDPLVSLFISSSRSKANHDAAAWDQDRFRITLFKLLT